MRSGGADQPETAGTRAGRFHEASPLARRTLGPVAALRVGLANPPAFGGPDYSHELARALGAAGADVELVTTRFRFGEWPEPEGYTRRELFYPMSSRLFRRSPLRIPLKVLEHPLGMAR